MRYFKLSFILILFADLLSAQMMNSVPLEKTKGYCSLKTDYWASQIPVQPRGEFCDISKYGEYFTFKARTNSLRVKFKAKPQDIKMVLAFFTWTPKDGLQTIKCKDINRIGDEQPEICYNKFIPDSNYMVGVFVDDVKVRFGLCLYDDELTNLECPEGDSFKETQIRIKGNIYNEKGEALPDHKIKVGKDHFFTDEDGGFNYAILHSDMANPLELKSASDVKLEISAFVYDDKNHVIKKMEKDEFGKFVFSDHDPNIEPVISISTKEVMVEEGKIAMVGQVFNKKDLNKGLGNTTIYLHDENKFKIDTTISNDKGHFHFTNLKPDKGYNISFESDENVYTELIIIDDKLKTLMKANSKMMDENGWFVFKELPYMETRMELFEINDTHIDFETLEKGQSLVLDNIQFESSQDKLLESSFEVLNELSTYLLKNENKKLIIIGHTDNVGDESNNQILSEKRAVAVKKYLHSKGIQPSRMLAEGEGSSRPIGNNETEQGRKLNRRVEFELYDQ